MIVHGMMGLGDNIYQRGFINQIQEDVYLRTPWPEIYEDLPHVKCTRPATRLRTQAKNVNNQKVWHQEPRGIAQSVSYGQDGIFHGMERSFGVVFHSLDLPDYGAIQSDVPYVVVRPVTLRKEWMAEARNPNPEYIAEAAQIARSAGFKVVSIADLAYGEEWSVGSLPESDVQYHHGELNVQQLLSLVKYAAAVVGGIGWLLPAAIAYGTPAWIVAGGHGGYNAPNKITHRSLDLSNLNIALPDNFCLCTNRQHHCDKHITNHADKFTKWLRRYSNLDA
jgi:hypothetical protein